MVEAPHPFKTEIEMMHQLWWDLTCPAGAYYGLDDVTWELVEDRLEVVGYSESEIESFMRLADETADLISVEDWEYVLPKMMEVIA